MLYLARLLATEGAANGHVAKTPRARRRPTWLARTERTSVRTRSPPLPPRRLDRRPADRLHRERFPSIPKRSSAAASMESSSRPSRPPRRAHVRARAHTHVRTRAHAHVAATFDYFQPDLPSRRERLRSNRDLLLKREGGSASGPAQPNPTDVTESQMTDRTIYFVAAPRQLCSAVENVPLLFSSNKSDTKRFPPGGTRPLLIDA